jgi:hypothetical protein
MIHVSLSFISSFSKTVLYLIRFNNTSFFNILSAKIFNSGIVQLFSDLSGDFQAKYLEKGADTDEVLASNQSEIIHIEL